MDNNLSLSTTVFIAIKKVDDAFILLDCTIHSKVPTSLDDVYTGCINHHGNQIQDYSPISLDDLGKFSDDFEFYMQSKETNYYIKKSFKIFIDELQAHSKAKHELKLKLEYEEYLKELKDAFEDQSPMSSPPIEEPEEEYSASKTVTKKMIALSKNCWKQTQKNINNIEIRDKMHQKLSEIWINAPEIADYDYEDASYGREEFWSQFPKSWERVFQYRYERDGNIDRHEFGTKIADYSLV